MHNPQHAIRPAPRPSLTALLARTREFGFGLVLRTFLLLLTARVALKSLPVARIIAWKQRPLPLSPPLPPEAIDAHCRRIRQTVLAVARNSPIEFVCFPQCLAAASLLRDLGIPTRLHYGVTRNPDHADRLITHTWLEAAGENIIGGEVAELFSTLAVY